VAKREAKAKGKGKDPKGKSKGDGKKGKKGKHGKGAHSLEEEGEEYPDGQLAEGENDAAELWGVIRANRNERRTARIGSSGCGELAYRRGDRSPTA
jgi:hypothetical protein